MVVDTAPVESSPVYEKVVMGFIFFALIAIVPLKPAVGVYVSEVPFAFGLNVSVLLAAVLLAAVCAVPIATVTVPPPVLPVIPAEIW
jgi:hypothetical protein